MLVQKMSKPGHGDSDSSGISTSTRQPDAALQDPATDLASLSQFSENKSLLGVLSEYQVYFYLQNIGDILC